MKKRVAWGSFGIAICLFLTSVALLIANSGNSDFSAATGLFAIAVLMSFEAKNAYISSRCFGMMNPLKVWLHKRGKASAYYLFCIIHFIVFIGFGVWELVNGFQR